MELGLALLDQNSIMQVDNNVKAVHNLVARLLLKDLSGLLPLVRFSRSLGDSHHPGAEEGPLLHVCPHQGGGHHGGDAALKTFMISTTRSPRSPSPLALSHKLLWMFPGEPPPHNKARICSGC